MLVYAFTKTYIAVPLAIGCALLVAVLPYIPNLINQKEVVVNAFITRYYRAFFYLIALGFGFLHMSNFMELTTQQLLFSPVLVLYQILLGLLLGFLRVNFKWGIIYSILIHAMFNSFPVLIKLL
jgi:hypothetical protein